VGPESEKPENHIKEGQSSLTTILTTQRHYQNIMIWVCDDLSEKSHEHYKTLLLAGRKVAREVTT
jgi:hypothetical protein